MIRHTGGLASGATSTRSRSCWRAMWSASGSGLIPSWVPSVSTSRTSRARILSFIRCSAESCAAAIGHHLCALWPARCRFLDNKKDRRREARLPLAASRPGAPGAFRRLVTRWGPEPHFPSSVCHLSYPNVSTLWTPDGERPVRRGGEGSSPPPSSAPPPPPAPPVGGDDDGLDDAEVRAQMEELRQQLLAA